MASKKDHPVFTLKDLSKIMIQFQNRLADLEINDDKTTEKLRVIDLNLKGQMRTQQGLTDSLHDLSKQCYLLDDSLAEEARESSRMQNELKKHLTEFSRFRESTEGRLQDMAETIDSLTANRRETRGHSPSNDSFDGVSSDSDHDSTDFSRRSVHNQGKNDYESNEDTSFMLQKAGRTDRTYLLST